MVRSEKLDRPLEAKVDLYIKHTSNCVGWPLTSFKVLSQVWKGEGVILPFGPEEEEVLLKVVGWTDLFMGTPCMVQAARVRTSEGNEGVLIWGGNSGVRILVGETDLEPADDGLDPPGWGQPFVWVQDESDLPDEVLASF